MTKIHEQEMELLQEENKNLQGFTLNERASMKERIDEIARRTETLDGLVDADKLTVFEAVMKLEGELKRVTQELDAQNAELAAQKLRRQRLRQQMAQRREGAEGAEGAKEATEQRVEASLVEGVRALEAQSENEEQFETAWRDKLKALGVSALSMVALVTWGLQYYQSLSNDALPAPELPDNVQYNTWYNLAQALAQKVAGGATWWMLTTYEGIEASLDDVDLSDWVVARGLVGQRGPACAAAADAAADDGASADARLAYELPSPEALGALLPHLKRLLLANDDDAPTDAQVQAALATLPAQQHGAGASASASAVAEALAAFKGDYAVVGTGDAVHADDARGGVEVPHWMPTTGARGRAAARVAALEHVVARCAKLAAAPSTSAGARSALRQAAAALKVEQMAPLYKIHEAVVYGEPEGTGCWHATPSDADEHVLVTRPCAVVRGHSP